MAVTALQLAGELVRRENARGRSLTNLSVQKLAYFCHGWHLALKGTPLVSDPFEAWKFGPVLPSVYHKFKVFSSNPIPATHPLVNHTAGVLDADSAKLIDRVLDVYEQYSGAQLVEMSHVGSGPWATAWNNSVSTMQDTDIRAYFQSLIKP